MSNTWTGRPSVRPRPYQSVTSTVASNTGTRSLSIVKLRILINKLFDVYRSND